MRKLLVFQHVPFEPLGTLNAQFKEAGFRIRYVNFDRQPDKPPVFMLTAVFAIRDGKQSREQGVWTGRIATPPTPFTLYGLER